MTSDDGMTITETLSQAVARQAAEIERLKAEIERRDEGIAQQVLDQKAEIERLRAEVEPLRIALGLLTTIKPTMEIDVTDPVGMAQQIAAHVADEIERLRGLLREGITKHDALTVVDSEPALWHYWKRVREALEK